MMEIVVATRMTNEKMTPRILILILFILKTVVSGNVVRLITTHYL